MNTFIEFDDEKKTIKSLNLDDFSIEDLEAYIKDLSTEIDRTRKEISSKKNLKKEAEKFFK